MVTSRQVLYTNAMQPTLPRAKSFKALIITLVSVFVIFPLILTAAAALLLPSVRMCSGVVRAGQEVTGKLEKNFTLLTYSYGCLSATPPTSKAQAVSMQLTSTKAFSSQIELRAAIASDLQVSGWTPVSSDSADAVKVGKNGFTTTIKSSSYQPALAQVSVRPDSPSVNYGLVFEKAPSLPRVLSEQDRLRFYIAPIYIPDYVPAGYTDWTVNTKFAGFGGDSMNRTTVNLNGGTGTVKPLLDITPIPANYDITHDCNVFISTTLSYACDQIGVTPSGVAVYLPQEMKPEGTPVTYDSSAVAIVNGYLVYFQYAHQHSNVSPQPSVDEIVKVYETLKQTNTPAKY